MMISLTELLQRSSANYLIYDLGRRLSAISQQQFADIEAQKQPYPFPLQQHACFAIAFWQEADQPFIWFLKFPVDERGLLDLSTRDQFCHNVITLLGNQITEALSDEQQQQLQNAPGLFTPGDDKRAAFNARLKLDLAQPPSIYFESAQSYLRQPEPLDSWQQLGLQGIHDVVARLRQDEATCMAITNNLQNYPAELWQPLAIAMEHQDLPASLYHYLAAELDQQVSNPSDDVTPRLHALRALAGNHTPAFGEQLENWLKSYQQHPLTDDEFIIIAGRLYQQLHDHQLVMVFFEALAEHNNQALLVGLFTDLVRLPLLRPQLLMMLQSSDLAKPLFKALQQLKGNRS
ncbi:Protein of unknown function [Pseudidiomarina planktonica]|uniref:DUF3549 domain-containing protein n=1 Tax=Pseudidiomarina planktonica TaxID=1323738 RepID=A0A1Y6ET96_9GAMM|nr:DUF3549 family protein [Pseudidiomarina planktonica]SMQ64431.1 Protein of unknown function [Pseudidiomarina planktonica]